MALATSASTAETVSAAADEKRHGPILRYVKDSDHACHKVGPQTSWSDFEELLIVSAHCWPSDIFNVTVIDLETPSALSNEDFQDAEHFRAAAENASRDADQLIAKLATAGLTVSIAVAGLVEDFSVLGLGWAAAGFGLAAIVSVVNQRLGADTLRKLCEKTYEVGAVEAQKSLDRRFAVLKTLNWIAVVLIVTGFGVATTFTFQLVTP